MFDRDSQMLAEYCRKCLDLSQVALSAEYGYDNLLLCIIDAIYSINARYESTEAVVNRFKAYYGGSPPEDIRELIALYDRYSPEYLASDVYCNRQRTSTRNGILKADAILHVGQVMLKHHVHNLAEFESVINNEDFERDFRAVRGQSSGVSLRYLYMLSGTQTEIKPDRMITRFLTSALNRNVEVAPSECHPLIAKACELLSSTIPGIAPRTLDHAIWQYQRQQ